jgi:hypothetical protein
MIVARAAVAGNPSAKSYWELIEEDGAKSFYKMDETSGTVCFDYGVNDEDGTYTNTPTLDQTGPSSTIPKAVSFAAASSEYMSTNEVADFNVNANSNWSADCWVKYNDTGTTIMGVYSIRQLSGDNGTLFILTANWTVAGRITLFIRLNNDTYLTLNSDGGWNNNAWHHLAVTATSGGAARLYIDGVERASSTSTRVNNTSNRRVYLATNALSQYFSGTIAAPAYYDRTLSAAEVDEHYQEGI